MMREPIYVPIPEADYSAALTTLLRNQSPIRVEDLVIQLLGDWLENQQASLQGGLTSGRGLQWKTVFIPEGSIVRTTVNGRVFAGKIIGNDLVFDSQVYSPAQFANRFGASGRNAWECLWILFPHARCWRRADACRPMRSLRKNKGK